MTKLIALESALQRVTLKIVLKLFCEPGFLWVCPTLLTPHNDNTFLLVAASLPVLSNLLHHILHSFLCVLRTSPPSHPPEVLPDPSGILYLFGLAHSFTWLCLVRTFVCAGWDLEIKEGRWLLNSF